MPPIPSTLNIMVTTPLTLPSLEALDWTWRGHNIRYTVMGTGKPLVLIHGFGASIGHWRKNIPELAAGGYCVYALDLLGFGASAKPAIDYSLELWQDLVSDFWQEKIQAPTVFIGNSIGALLSLMLVANHPDKSAGGVLLNCAGGLNHGSEDMNPIFRGIMGFFTAIVNSDVLGPLVFNQVRRKSQIQRTLYQVYGNREAVTPELVDLLHEPSGHEGAQKVFASILRAPSGPTPAQLLSHIQHPLLVLWGEKDPWAPVSVGRRMFDRSNSDTSASASAAASPDTSPTPSLDFEAIPATGHCPHDERPEEVNPRILQWLHRHHL